MARILVTPTLLLNAPGPYRDVLDRAGFEVVYPPADAPLDDPEYLLSLLDGVEGVLAGIDPYTSSVLARSKLRCVARVGVGYDTIDVPAATELGIAVTITPGTNEQSVAEQAVALMLGVCRGFPDRDREVRSGVWYRRPLPRMAGKTLGLVGLGRTGKAVVSKAQGLGLTVIAYDPFPDQAFAKSRGVRLVALDELLRTVDIVSLHLPCTPETADMINAKSLATMKPGAVLVNSSRGGLVDEVALAESLRSGHLFGAGLDVFKIEPLPLDSPLLGLPNVLLAPHMGGLDLESAEAMTVLGAKCLADLYAGRWPEGCVVNESIRPGWKW